MCSKFRIYLLLLYSVVINSCSQEIDKGNKKVFRYNEIGDVTSLDPARAQSFENIWVDEQIYNGLVQLDDSLKVCPDIAKSWNLSDNGKTYTFHLKNNVHFQSDTILGKKVKAKDFRFSFNRLFNPVISDVAGLLSTIFDTLSNVKNRDFFEARDDTTFIIHLLKPFAPFMNILTMKYFSVVPEEMVKFYGRDFGSHPIGTGPFIFKKWSKREEIILVRNPHYFETDREGNALPYLDGVVITFIKDPETSFLEFTDGNEDMVSGEAAVNPMVILDADGKLKHEFEDKFYLQRLPFLKTDYYGFILDSIVNGVANPLHSNLLRRAINYAINREQLVRYIRYNIGYSASVGFVPPVLKSMQVKPIFNYNPLKASQLLDAAGFPGGKGLPEIPLHVAAEGVAMAEAVQSQLARVGIKIKIQKEQPAVIAENAAEGNYTFFKKSWVGDYPDGENFLSLFWSANLAPKGVNFFHYSSPSFDSLYEKSEKELSDSVRLEDYTKLDSIAMSGAPVVPLFYDEVVRLISKRITGLHLNPVNSLDLRRVRKD